MIETKGYAIVRNAIVKETIAELRLEAERLAEVVPDRAYGIRDLFTYSPRIAELGRSQAMCQHLPDPQLAPVRAILFDKIPGSNWKVPTHQDLTIAVRERHDIDGYGPWSLKANIPHVQPPMALLEGMVTLRLHLDPTPVTNGALRVIPGSHLHTRIPSGDIPALLGRDPEVCCACDAGDLLLMKPLAKDI